MRRFWTRKKVGIVAGLVVVVLGALALSFGPIVRWKARGAAERYGASVEIDWVLPGWGGLELRGVRVSHPEAPGIKTELEEVRVSWGQPRKVEVSAGRVVLEGDRDELRAQVERVRDSLPQRSEGGQGGGTELTVRGLEIDFKGGAESVHAKGVSFSRSSGTWVLDAESLELARSEVNAKVIGLGVELERGEQGFQLSRLRTQGVEATVRLGKDAVGSDAAAPSDVVLVASSAGNTARMIALRAILADARSTIDERLAANGRVELAGVRATIDRAGETLNLGPATIRLRRDDGKIVGEYLAGRAATDPGVTEEVGADGLLVRATFPDASEPLGIDVRGGPITLSSLGVRDGEYHLLDVDQTSVRATARIELSATGDAVTFDGEARVNGLSFDVRAISREPVRGLVASFRGKVRAPLDRSKLRVEKGELEIGSVRLVGGLDVDRDTSVSPPRLRVNATYEVPLVPCQAFIDAAPAGLLPSVKGVRLAGSYALKGSAKFDTAHIDRDFDVRWDVASTCRIVDVPPAIDVERFRKAFTRKVSSSDGKEVEIETGPGTSSWASYGAISRFMEMAVITCEDGRFRRHEGFDHEAIKNSIRENLRTGKFVRGASTISMQLAKNLYLSREKTLSRKLEEAVLTMYLEQALTKEQIIELYLNVVEFGPMVYGVDAAAAHYFRTAPSRLHVSQAFYLASILPSPKVQHFSQGGSVSPGWTKHLRTLMKYANKRDRLGDEELAAGLAEIAVFGSPAPMRDANAEVPLLDPDDATLDIRDTAGDAP